MTTEKCYFCESKVEAEREAKHSRTLYCCNNCGKYLLTDCIKSTIEEKYKKHIIAGYLMNTKNLRKYNSELSREQNEKNMLLSEPKLNSIMTDPIIPKTTLQKIENLLLFFYRRNEYIGQIHSYIQAVDGIVHHNVNIIKESHIHPYTFYAVNNDEIKAIIEELIKMGYLDVVRIVADIIDFKIASRGFERAEQLLSTNIDSKKVFVAMGFKDELLSAMENAIKPACNDCGFEAFLITDKEHNNGITDEIIVAIKTSKFVITDFTYNNCGAYFEAGYAQGHGLEVIRCCKKEWFDGNDANGNKNKLHFDVGHYNFIIWENEDDLKKKLKNRIRAIISGAKLTDGLL